MSLHRDGRVRGVRPNSVMVRGVMIGQWGVGRAVSQHLILSAILLWGAKLLIIIALSWLIFINLLHASITQTNKQTNSEYTLLFSISNVYNMYL